MLQYRLLITISLAAALFMVGVGLMVPLLPQRIVDMDGSIKTVGHITSVFALSYLLFQLVIGSSADKFGVKPFMVCGYLLCGVSGLFFFYAQSSGTILAGRLIQGAGEAPIWALGPALLSSAYPNAKGKVIGFYNAAIHAGLTLGPLLGLLYFPSGISNAPFLIFTLLCFCSGIIILLCLSRSQPLLVTSYDPSARLQKSLSLLRLKAPLVTLAGILIYGAAYGIFTSVLPAYLFAAKGFDHQSVGIFFILFFIAIGVSQIIAGPLSDQYDRRAFMCSGFIIACIGIGLFDFLPYPWIYISLTAASFGLGIFCVTSMAHLYECVPDSLRGSISGGYYLAWGLGVFCGPLFIGLISEMYSSRLSYQILAFLMLGLTSLFWLGNHQTKKIEIV